MKTRTLRLTANSLLSLALIATAGYATAADADADKKSAADRAQKQVVAYVPPSRGAPAARVGGASRGLDQPLSLEVLSPEHTGLTARAQPGLYWYASHAVVGPLEFTITDATTLQPVFEFIQQGGASAGIHKFDLARYEVTLQLDREYEWYVAAIIDPAHRSLDVVAGSKIKRVAKPGISRVDNPDPLSAAQSLARDGLWYDAVDLLSELIQNNRAAGAYRDGLLNQVGLQQVAGFGRGTE